MRSAVADILPPRLKRSLAKFGRDLALARRKRRLTLDMMAERVGVTKATYQRLEKGDPTVAFGAYVMALWVLGFGDAFLVDTVNQRSSLPVGHQGDAAKQQTERTAQQDPATQGKHRRCDDEDAWLPSEKPHDPVHEAHAGLQPEPVACCHGAIFQPCLEDPS